ncbi:MAG: hypothetical protein JHC87_02735 [Thermoleophilaceae bacterium]|nr:hypothetical protein [Thermoleophilaceae bacterium]
MPFRSDSSLSRKLAMNAAAVTLLLAGGAAAAMLSLARPLAKAPNCAIFPADNPWNQRVDALPVAADSDQMVESIGVEANAHADFGSALIDGQPIGIPYVVTAWSKRAKRVRYTEYGSESDRQRFAIPRRAPIEGGAASDGDRHVIAIDRRRCQLFELYHARALKGGKRWQAGSGAMFNLRTNDLRPAGWTSADAAGLPIFPGLARFDEVASGEIDHALRFTATRTRDTYVYPARHAAGVDDPTLPPMGLRVRLKANVNLSEYPAQSQVVLRALQRYGMILADNGTSWYVSGAPSPKWDDDDLRSMSALVGSDFEVVDTSSLPTPGL